MNINNKNYIITPEILEMFQDNWQDNINEFKQQNTAIIINHIQGVTEEDIAKFIDATIGDQLSDNTVIDSRFIMTHFDGVVVNPQVKELKQGHTVQCDLVPDISFVKLLGR